MEFKKTLAKIEANLKKEHPAILGGAIQVVVSVLVVTMLLVVGAVLLGQLNSVNASSLGNNSNATNQINLGFALLSTSQGIIVLVVVIALLALAIGVLLGAFGGIGAQGGRGGR